MPKEIVLNIKRKENKFKLYWPWIVIAIIITFLIFSASFALGKFTEFEIPLLTRSENEATKSATRKGWYVYQSKDFSIEYPRRWEVEKNSEDDPTGVKIETDGARIQLWLTNVREYRFSKEQLKAQKETKNSTLQVDGREAKVKKFLYKEGDIFTVVEVPNTREKPKAVFWITAADSEFEKSSLEIVKTFTSNRTAVKEQKDE